MKIFKVGWKDFVGFKIMGTEVLGRDPRGSVEEEGDQWRRPTRFDVRRCHSMLGCFVSCHRGGKSLRLPGRKQ